MGEKSQNKNKNSRVAQNFYIIVLNFMENDQKNNKKLGTFYRFLHTVWAYFCLIFTTFWKKLIFASPKHGSFNKLCSECDML